MFKRQYKNNDWIKYSIGACLSFGFSNFFIGDLATKYGHTGVYPLSLGQILTWLIYHASVKSSKIYDKNNTAKIGIVIRGLNHLLLMVVTFMAFKYSNLAHVN